VPNDNKNISLIIGTASDISQSTLLSWGLSTEEAGSSESRYRRVNWLASSCREPEEPLIIHTSHIQDVLLSEKSRQQCLQSNLNNPLLQTIQLYIARHDHTR
jgi:hypothetical protein